MERSSIRELVAAFLIVVVIIVFAGLAVSAGQFVGAQASSALHQLFAEYPALWDEADLWR